MLLHFIVYQIVFPLNHLYFNPVLLNLHVRNIVFEDVYGIDRAQINRLSPLSGGLLQTPEFIYHFLLRHITCIADDQSFILMWRFHGYSIRTDCHYQVGVGLSDVFFLASAILYGLEQVCIVSSHERHAFPLAMLAAHWLSSQVCTSIGRSAVRVKFVTIVL